MSQQASELVGEEFSISADWRLASLPERPGP